MTKNEFNLTEIYLAFWIGKLEKFINNVDLIKYLLEILRDKTFLNDIFESTRLEPTFSGNFSKITDFRLTRLFYYCLVRSIKPNYVLETGVMHGLSSIFILKALEKNNLGKLISIDLPSYKHEGPASKDGYLETLPSKKEPGWIVENIKGLNKRWELKLGSSNKILNNLNLNQSLDVFIHDSDHSYENVKFELNWAKKNTKNNGILICDNIEANDACRNFCKEFNLNYLAIPNFNDDYFMELRTSIIKL